MAWRMMVHSRTTPSRGATRGRTPQPRHRPRPHPATSTSSRRARGTRRARRRRRERLLDCVLRHLAGRHADRRVQRGARVPHVTQSPGHVAGHARQPTRWRAHLEGVLRGLGLQTQVQDSAARRAAPPLARVRNVVARLPGTDPTGTVFLVAHYDAVQTGPGGNDDAAGVATILEVARALTDGRRPATTSSSSSPTPRRRASAEPRRSPPSIRWPPARGWCSTWRHGAAPAR